MKKIHQTETYRTWNEQPQLAKYGILPPPPDLNNNWMTAVIG